MVLLFLLCGVLLCAMGCGTGGVYVPKPRAYARMELPPPSYKPLPDTLPYFFEASVHSRLRPDSSLLAERYWMELYYPLWGASIQMTYKPVKGDKELLYGYLEDTYRLTSKHHIKAYRIEERRLMLPMGDSVSIIRLQGEVPTPLQFHVTDSLQHYFRAALYFNTAIRDDSLAPVLRYLEADIAHLLATFHWQDIK